MVLLESFIDVILLATIDSGVNSAFNSCENQEYFLGGKGSWCIRLTTLPTFMCRLFWNLGTSTSWNPQGLSRPVQGLLYLLPNLFVQVTCCKRFNYLWIMWPGSSFSELAKSCPLPVDPHSLDSPHTKALLLLQAHFSRLQLPCTDYFTDLKSVLDQTVRILQVSPVR